MPKLWPAALFALLALAPLAQAAPADGRIEAASLTLEPSELTATQLGLRWDQDGVPTLDLAAEQITISRTGTRTTQDAFGQVQIGVIPVEEKFEHERSSVSLRVGDGSQVIALRARGTIDGTFGSATARPVGGAMLADDPFESSGDFVEAACDSQQYRCVDIFGAYELTTSSALSAIGGDLTLLLRGPTLIVGGSSGATEYASGTSSTTTGAVKSTDDTVIMVRATGVTGSVSSTAPSTWFAVDPVMKTPAASFDDATGALRVGAVHYRANDQDVRAAGALEILLEPVPATTHGDRNTGAPIVYAPTFAAQIHGDVSAVNLAATPVFVDEPAQAAGFAAALLAAGAALAWFWPHLSFAAASLYTRLQKPDILDNEVRNAIYDIIRQHPGISAREVHRQSQQSWGTVVYHLRQLERHHLVVSRALGRTRNYYENHGKYKGMEVQLACLQSDRARLLARAIVEQPGITQEQLAAATGFPQPTTSYYVRKLKQAGLVQEQREGRYAKYVPIGDVGRFVEMSESMPLVGGSSPTGVAP